MFAVYHCASTTYLCPCLIYFDILYMCHCVVRVPLRVFYVVSSELFIFILIGGLYISTFHYSSSTTGCDLSLQSVHCRSYMYMFNKEYYIFISGLRICWRTGHYSLKLRGGVIETYPDKIEYVPYVRKTLSKTNIIFYSVAKNTLIFVVCTFEINIIIILQYINLTC